MGLWREVRRSLGRCGAFDRLLWKFDVGDGVGRRWLRSGAAAESRTSEATERSASGICAKGDWRRGSDSLRCVHSKVQMLLRLVLERWL